MLIEEKKGKTCPRYGHQIGDLSCEECVHWKHKPSGKRNQYGIMTSIEWCDLDSEDSEDGA